MRKARRTHGDMVRIHSNSRGICEIPAEARVLFRRCRGDAGRRGGSRMRTVLI